MVAHRFSGFVVLCLLAGSVTAHAACTVPPGAAACIDPSYFAAVVDPAINGCVTQVFSVTTSSAPIPKVDVVFAIDRTGSMGDEIAVVKTNAVSIMNSIRALVPDSDFGLVTFMDYPGYFSYPGYAANYGDASFGDVPFEIDHAVGNDVPGVAAAIGGLTLGDGGDGPQDYTRVLYDALNEPGVAWRPDAKHILIMFGDNATHDLTFAGYNFGGDPGHDGIAMTGDDLVFVDVVQQLRDAGLVVLAVNSGSGGTDVATFQGMSIGYATSPGTNGQYFQLSNASQIPQAILNMVMGETQVIHQLTLQVAAPFSGWLSSVVPPAATEVGPNTTTSFTVTFCVPPGTPNETYRFPLVAVGDGASLTSSTIDLGVATSTPTQRLSMGQLKVKYVSLAAARK